MGGGKSAEHLRAIEEKVVRRRLNKRGRDLACVRLARACLHACGRVLGVGKKANVRVTRPCRLQFRCSSTCLGQPGDASRFPWGSVSRTDANKPCHRKGNRLPARRKDSPLCGIGHAVMAVHRGVSWRFMAPVARFPCARSELEKLSAFSTKIVHVMKKQSVSGAAARVGTGG